MLGAIVAVTMSVSDLTATEAAYSQYLEYRVVERGTISADQAAVWNAPAAAGSPYLLMQPASGAEVYFRFIEAPVVPGYKSMHHYGWNAIELLVTDVHAAYERMKDAPPFTYIAGPRALSTTDEIVAMQMLGPDEVMIYLTQITNESFGLGTAQSFIDRVFIVIDGGPSIDAHIDFFGKTLGIETSPPIPVRMSALNKVRGFDSEAMYPLSTANIGGPFKIELDEYPAGTTERPIAAGHIPPGIAIVSFAVESVDAIPVETRAPAAALSGLPYNDGKAAVIVGSAGEWIEVIEK